MAVTAQMVKELREKTGAGMLECKNALQEADGDINKAVEVLREKGLASAQQKAGRIASEGMVDVYLNDSQTVGAIVEVNSETDFVAKNQEFRTFVAQVAKQAAETTAADMEAFLKEPWSAGGADSVSDALTQKIAVIGENLNIRRFEKIQAGSDSVVISYIHGGGRIAVLLEVKAGTVNDQVKTMGKNIAMQIAALNPQFISREDVSADFIEKEKVILKQQAMNENANKPEHVIEKMVEGRLNKELKEMCLLNQDYVQDSDMSVEKYIQSVAKEVGTDIKIAKMIRFETGEGLEKKQENFAEEVNKAVQG